MTCAAYCKHIRAHIYMYTCTWLPAVGRDMIAARAFFLSLVSAPPLLLRSSMIENSNFFLSSLGYLPQQAAGH